MPDIESVRRGIEAVRRYRQQHGFRAWTLAPDLALVGLTDDLTDAAETALDLLASARPYRAYMMARVAFEAAQRLLILATTPNYLQLGVRAWVYYQEKDSEFEPSRASGENPDREEQILAVWERYCPEARALIAAERTFLQTTRGPDNFLRRNLADAAQEAYAVLAGWRGREVPKTSRTDSTVYKVLSRDSHACVRLEPRGFKIDADGFVEVIEGTRDASVVGGPVTQSLDISLGEAHTALEYRMERLRAEHARKLSLALSSPHTSPLPPLPTNFVPDLGLELSGEGWGDRQIAFPGVPVSKIGTLPGGALSFTVRTSSDSEARTATFDFKGVQRVALERANLRSPSCQRCLDYKHRVCRPFLYLRE